MKRLYSPYKMYVSTQINIFALLHGKNDFLLKDFLDNFSRMQVRQVILLNYQNDYEERSN